MNSDKNSEGIVGRVGRATASDALCRGFDPCRQRPRGVAVDFGPKQSRWLINQLGDPSSEELRADGRNSHLFRGNSDLFSGNLEEI
jgi:hypothetical protein